MLKPPAIAVRGQLVAEEGRPPASREPAHYLPTLVARGARRIPIPTLGEDPLEALPFSTAGRIRSTGKRGRVLLALKILPDGVATYDFVPTTLVLKDLQVLRDVVAENFQTGGRVVLCDLNVAFEHPRVGDQHSACVHLLDLDVAAR